MELMPVLEENDFRKIADLMASVSGIKMAPHKRALVAGRLQKRLKALQLPNYADYVMYISDINHQEERRIAVDLLTTNETFFFREKAHFDLVYKLLSQYPNRPVKIWSAASSSGEEVYTLAMTTAAALTPATQWEVIGSDICRPVLEKAKQAVYPLTRIDDIPKEWLSQYCEKGVGDMDGMFRIKPELRRHIRFECLNLNEKLPEKWGNFDIVFLRNMLIYFDLPAKLKIINHILPHLKPGGLLFVGHSEGLHGLELPLTSYAPSVYRKMP